MFIKYYIRAILFQKRICKLKYHKTICDNDYSNKYICSIIDSNRPFLAARLGSVELLSCGYAIAKKRHILPKKFLGLIRNYAYTNAGVFNNTIQDFYNFTAKYESSISNIDIGLVWDAPFEDYFYNKYLKKNSILAHWDISKPYYNVEPWTYHLKNKKVLIVSPMVDSIKMQYKKRKDLFENKKVLPDFKPIFYRSLNTVKGEKIIYDTWNEALKKMEDDISKLDFDIALLGCGAYGLPLGDYIKRMGKQAIVMCSSLQVLFGIYGNSVGKTEYEQFGNSMWSRPLESEKPKNANNIENSRYW